MTQRRDEGAVAVIVALVLLVFVAAVALAVDVGGLMLHRRELVNGSDAAALSAARTCARGGADSHGTPESAADHQALANSTITAGEAATTNILDMSPCGSVSGHVTVGYTSDQELFFAPVIGFNHESPVHTEATASWGLGSNNSVPLILSGLFSASCPIPPRGTAPAIGATCSFWFDNGALGNGNFAFLSLSPKGWNVPSDANCSAEGSSQIEDWILGTDVESISLNWTDPTYSCAVPGLRGANPNSKVWGDLLSLKGQLRDFPINWEGPGEPIPGAPSQGMIVKNGDIDKYDIIGFASLRIVNVLSVKQAENTQTTQQPFTAFTYTNTGITFSATLPAGSVVNYRWTGTKSNGQAVGGTCNFATGAPFVPGTYSWRTLGGTGNGCPGNNETLNAGQPSPITITQPVTTTTYGSCGPPPPNNSSAECLVTEWNGSTLSGDYNQPLDNVRVVRLCDLAEGTCLDQ
jgi:Flp pilus assembly protein TadG